MSRIAHVVATATIAVVLGTTAANVLCAAGCDRDRPVAAKSDHCHDDATAATGVAGADDCSEHASQASGSIARTEPLKMFAADRSSTPGPPVADAATESLISTVRPAASPPGPHAIPLRI